MSDRSLAIGNDILRNVSSSGWSNMLFNPLLAFVSIVLYLIFAFWYMSIVHNIELSSDSLPLHFGLAVYLLAALGILLAFATYYIIVIRLRMHSNHEKEFRSLLLEYFTEKCSERNIDPPELQSAKDKDANIVLTEQPYSEKRLLLLIPISLFILFISLIIDGVNDNIGTITWLMMMIVFAVLLILSPEITTFPYEHEKRFLSFFSDIIALEKAVGMEPTPFDCDLPKLDYSKLKKRTICTIGCVSITWSYRLYRNVDKHFIAHKHTEIALMSNIWLEETGHLPKNGF